MSKDGPKTASTKDIRQAIVSGNVRPKSALETEHDKGVAQIKAQFAPVVVAPSNRLLKDITPDIAALGQFAMDHFKANEGKRMRDVFGTWEGKIARIRTDESDRVEGAGGVKSEDAVLQTVHNEFVRVRKMRRALQAENAFHKDCVIVVKADRLYYRESKVDAEKRVERETVRDV